MENLIKRVLREFVEKKVTKFPITPKKLKDLINSQYELCNGNDLKNGCVGKITTETCDTDYGVIGGLYSEKNYFGDDFSDWSIINRFDTNSRVHKKIIELYYEFNDSTEKSLDKWIYDNAKELFNGIYTKDLVLINKETIEKGNNTENFAKSILERLYPNSTIKQHCAGDIRDRKLGQDFDVIINSMSHYFQIKPIRLVDIKKYDSDRGVYYEIPSYYDSSKYSEENVDAIMYVDLSEKKYIIFHNDFSKILTTKRKSFNPKLPSFNIFYYEEPIHTNMKIQLSDSLNTKKIKPGLKQIFNSDNI